MDDDEQSVLAMGPRARESYFRQQRIHIRDTQEFAEALRRIQFREEWKCVRAKANRLSDPKERLDFLMRIHDGQLAYRKLLFDIHRVRQQFAQSDAALEKLIPRRRGDRSKSRNGKALERLAVALVRARARQLKEAGIATFERRQARARKEIAPFFGVSPQTLLNWQCRQSRR